MEKLLEELKIIVVSTATESKFPDQVNEILVFMGGFDEPKFNDIDTTI